jgi:hypothetical protein
MIDRDRLGSWPRASGNDDDLACDPSVAAIQRQDVE